MANIQSIPLPSGAFLAQPGWEDGADAPGGHATGSVPLTVVVVTYNSKRHITACLTPLRSMRVVVVDNCSTDGTQDLIREEFPWVRLVVMPRNEGLSAAFNVGWKCLPESDVFFLNPDVVATPEGIRRLQSELHKDPDIAVTAPRLLNPDGSPQLTARSFPTIASTLARRTPAGRTPWGRRALARHLCTAQASSTASAPADWVLGAAMMISARALRELDGLDPAFFLYCEDVDFCARAWLAGFKVVYFPSVSFVHEYQRASKRTWDLSSRATRIHLRSTLRLVRLYTLEFLGRPLRRRV